MLTHARKGVREARGRKYDNVKMIEASRGKDNDDDNDDVNATN